MESYGILIYTTCRSIPTIQIPGGGGGSYFPVKDYCGYAAGWGRIFTTGVTIVGVTFLVELLEWGRKLWGFLG